LVSHFTEEYFKSENWTKGARRVLYKRFEEIMSEKGESGVHPATIWNASIGTRSKV
jgi:hypothetical protein